MRSFFYAAVMLLLSTTVMADDFAYIMSQASSLGGQWKTSNQSVESEVGETTVSESAITWAYDPVNPMNYTMWSPDFMMQMSYLGNGRYLRLGWNTVGLYVEKTEYQSFFSEAPNSEGDFTLVSTSWVTQPNGSSFEQRSTTKLNQGVLTMTRMSRPPGAVEFEETSSSIYTRERNALPDGPLITGRLVTPEDYNNSNWQVDALTMAADLLEQHYIYPDKGELLATYLRENLEAFSAVTEKKDFATMISSELQEVVNDGHLRISYAFEQQEESEVVFDTERPFDCRTATIEYRTLENNIGNIQIPHFSRNTQSLLPRFEMAIAELADTDALVIDLRGNCGGSEEVLIEMESYFFAESTLLNASEERDEEISESWSLDNVPGVRYLKPVYILVNNRTASAGESFAFSLGLVTGRAIVVGSRTAGLGHFGGNYAIGAEFRMFIPRGRPFDPKTGLGFETAGVTPDIESSSEDALNVALNDFAEKR